MEERYIVDKNEYPLGKDINGKEVNISEIQAIVFSIILEIDRICRKNDIPYALSYGSALGIINYQGFIPWDDDADIAIDYFDIPRLIKAFESDLSPEYEFICYEKNDGYNVVLPTFKVVKRTGYMQDKNYKVLPDHTGTYEGFFVDIVALMGMKSPAAHRNAIFKSKCRLVAYFISDVILRHDPKGMKKKMKAKENKLASLYKDEKYICQSIVIPFQTSKHNLYPRDVIYPFKEYLFNGVKLYSFNDVEAFCKIKYGEKCFKKEVNGALIDPLPFKKRKSLHIRQFSLTDKK